MSLQSAELHGHGLCAEFQAAILQMHRVERDLGEQLETSDCRRYHRQKNNFKCVQGLGARIQTEGRCYLQETFQGRSGFT